MIHGLIVINKKQNTTSYTIVNKIKKITKVKKVGHFGTLDPYAEGVLLIGIGKATKFFDFYIKKEKLYTGKIKFGVATSTYDSEGVPVSEPKEIDLNRIDIQNLLNDFTGEINQIPPIYSAKKYKGKPLYKYARENKPVSLTPAKVFIYSLKAKIISLNTLWFEALTSSGTYIRSLAHDMGKKIGSGAYLEELKRERIGEFNIEKAISIEEFEGKISSSKISEIIIPIESLLPEFPKIIITQPARRKIINGVALNYEDIKKIFAIKDSLYFRIFDEAGKLLAIAKKDQSNKKLQPHMVFPD